MPNTYLRNVSRVILSAGHGGGDPGAVANGTTENFETNQIVSRLARILKFNGMPVEVIPDLNLSGAIRYINQNYKWGSDWCIEIHKDSANLDPNRLRNIVGFLYYGGDSNSEAIAKTMRASVVNSGANPNSYVRPDTNTRFGRLGWVRDTIPLSHLIECGFIQDNVADSDDEKYAKWVAKAILDALEKPFKYDLNQPQPIPQPMSKLSDFAKDYNFNELPNEIQNAVNSNDLTYILNILQETRRENEARLREVQDLRQRLVEVRAYALDAAKRIQAILGLWGG